MTRPADAEDWRRRPSSGECHNDFVRCGETADECRRACFPVCTAPNAGTVCRNHVLVGTPVIRCSAHVYQDGAAEAWWVILGLVCCNGGVPGFPFYRLPLRPCPDAGFVATPGGYPASRVSGAGSGLTAAWHRQR